MHSTITPYKIIIENHTPVYISIIYSPSWEQHSKKGILVGNQVNRMYQFGFMSPIDCCYSITVKFKRTVIQY